MAPDDEPILHNNSVSRANVNCGMTQKQATVQVWKLTDYSSALSKWKSIISLLMIYTCSGSNTIPWCYLTISIALVIFLKTLVVSRTKINHLTAITKFFLWVQTPPPPIHPSTAPSHRKRLTCSSILSLINHAPCDCYPSLAKSHVTVIQVQPRLIKLYIQMRSC